MKFKQILCAIDFSAGSHQPLELAARIAVESDAALVLLHAVYLPPSVFAGELPPPSSALELLSDEARRGLDAATADATRLGAPRVTSRLVNGSPWQQIVDTAIEDPGFDLVVVGTHGRTGIGRFLLGSVAEKVLRHAPCSVLVVRPDTDAAAFNHVLCPVDFSPNSEVAIDMVADLVRPDGQGVALLHVVEAPISYRMQPPMLDFISDIDRRSTRRLAELATRAAGTTPVRVTTATRIGSAGAQILAAIEDDQTIDLVVMGSHGRTGIRRALLGSVAEKVVRHTHVPVLIARAKRT